MKKVDSGQWTVVRKKDVGTQNWTRENIMLTYNDQTKARFSLSLDGRGARGEGVALPGKAGLLLAACLLYLATAPAALADNECGDPSANGGADDSFTCPTGDQSATGFTHNSDGNLELIVPFVSDVSSSPDLDVGSNGIVTTGNGSDNLTLDATRGLTPPFSTGHGVDIRGSGDAVIDFTAVDGNINIEVDDVRGGADTIRARTTGSGNIDITSNAFISQASETGIDAVTAGGDISVTAHRGVRGNTVAGIFADAGGGDISIIADNLSSRQYDFRAPRS